MGRNSHLSRKARPRLLDFHLLAHLASCVSCLSCVSCPPGSFFFSLDGISINKMRSPSLSRFRRCFDSPRRDARKRVGHDAVRQDREPVCGMAIPVTTAMFRGIG